MLQLKKELEVLTGAYSEEAPEEAVYPYAVFSAQRLEESEGKQTFTLEINVWDQHPYYSRAESVMDMLEKKLHRCNQEKIYMAAGMGRRKSSDKGAAEIIHKHESGNPGTEL